jgi:ribonuclease HI
VSNDEILLWGFGGTPCTSNNLMELEGACCGLEAVLSVQLKKGETIELVSDSRYTLGMASRAYSANTNLKMVARLQALVGKLGSLHLRWVKGHSGNKYNEKCDELATLGKIENTPFHLRKQPKIKRNKRAERRQRAKELLKTGTLP